MRNNARFTGLVLPLNIIFNLWSTFTVECGDRTLMGDDTEAPWIRHKPHPPPFLHESSPEVVRDCTLNRCGVRGTRLQHDGAWLTHCHSTIRRVKVLILEPLVCYVRVLAVAHVVWFVQDLLPVHPVGQDENAGLGRLEQGVQQREHVHPSNQLRGERQLQDSSAQLHILASCLQGDGPAAVGGQVEEHGQAVPGRVATQRHQDGHHVYGGRDGGQQLWPQHCSGEDEEQQEGDQQRPQRCLEHTRWPHSSQKGQIAPTKLLAIAKNASLTSFT